MTATTPGGYMLQQSEGADDMEDIEILNTKDRHLIQDRDDILPISHTYHFSLTVLSMCELFRKRKFLSVVMPDSSKQLHLRHYDVYGDSKPASQLLRRVISPSQSKMSLIRQLLESIPEREREMEKEDYSKCTLRAKKGYDRSSGRSVMVFKRSRPNKKKQPCGMVDCPVCGVFWRKYSFDVVSCSIATRYELDKANELTHVRYGNGRSRKACSRPRLGAGRPQAIVAQESGYITGALHGWIYHVDLD